MSGPADTPYRRRTDDPWDDSETQKPLKTIPGDTANLTAAQVWKTLVGSAPPTSEETMSAPILFKDLPVGAVFTHGRPANEWWMKVPDGSIRVSQEGARSPDAMMQGVAATRQDSLCYTGRTNNRRRLYTLLDFIESATERNKTLLAQAAQPWQQRLNRLAELRQNASDDLLVLDGGRP